MTTWDVPLRDVEVVLAIYDRPSDDRNRHTMTRDFPPALFESLVRVFVCQKKKREVVKKGEKTHETLVASTAAVHLRTRSAMTRTVPMMRVVVCEKKLLGC